MRKTMQFAQEKFKQVVKPENKRRAIIISTAAVFLLTLIYWIISGDRISTDDGYVNANQVQVACRVTGQVAHLYVKNNQFVKAGQPLFDLDPEPFNIAITQAQAQVIIDQSNLDDVTKATQRTLALVKQKNLSAQAGDDATAKLQAATAQLQAAQAALSQARLNLQYAHVVSPVDGWVTNMSLREGNIVGANQPLFALIDNSEYWVDANYKETQLGHIKPGQKAVIEVDMYPSHPFKGVVDSISGGSGTAFSLLPPQNATGNWVKVTQRVPVKIHFVHPDPAYPLRIGTTANVTIYLNTIKK